MLTVHGRHATQDLPNNQRLTDLHAMIARGNHLSAKQRTTKLEKMMQAEVHHGWQLPLPPFQLPCSFPTPLPCQWASLSRPTLTNTAILLTSSASPMTSPTTRSKAPVAPSMIGCTASCSSLVYLGTLLYHIHQIVVLHHHHLDKIILQSEVDFKNPPPQYRPWFLSDISF
jgi:hypothetical protein